MPPKLIRSTYAIAIAEYLRKEHANILFVSPCQQYSILLCLRGRGVNEKIFLEYFRRQPDKFSPTKYSVIDLNEATFLFRMSTMRIVLQWLDDKGYIMQELTHNPLPPKYKDNY